MTTKPKPSATTHHQPELPVGAPSSADGDARAQLSTDVTSGKPDPPSEITIALHAFARAFARAAARRDWALALAETKTKTNEATHD